MKNFYNSMFYLSKDEITYKEIRQNLRIQSNKGFRGSTLTEDCWEETDDHYKVPLAWAYDRFQGTDKTPKVTKKWPKVDIDYRYNQDEVITDTLKHLKTNRCSRIVAETGYGKSVMVIEIARKLKTNVLIVTPSNEIIAGFKETAKELYGIKCGQIKGKKDNTDELITLTTYQTLAKRVNLDPEYLDKFGMLAVDEAHLSGCASLQKILFKINARYRLSVSADFYRADGLVGVYEICLGEVAATGSIPEDQKIEKFIYKPKLPAYVNMSKARDWQGALIKAKYETLLSESKEYNRYISDLCMKLIKKGDRRVLVYLKRIEQSLLLQEILGDNAGLFTGKVKEKDLKENAKKPILLYTKSPLGLDMSKYLGKEEEAKLAPLNTCFIASPSANTNQITGRTGRMFRGVSGLLILPEINDFFSKSQLKKDLIKNYKKFKIITSLDDIL